MDMEFALSRARVIRDLGDRAFAAAMVECVKRADPLVANGTFDTSAPRECIAQAAELFLPAEWWMSPEMATAIRSEWLEPTIRVIPTTALEGFGTSAEISFILGIGAILSWTETMVKSEVQYAGWALTAAETLMVPASINPDRVLLVQYDASSFIAI